MRFSIRFLKYCKGINFKSVQKRSGVEVGSHNGYLHVDETDAPLKGGDNLRSALLSLNRPFYLVDDGPEVAIAYNGTAVPDTPWPQVAGKAYPIRAIVPAIQPETLGDPVFKSRHNLRYAYVMGAMANGITSVEMVKAAGQAGMIGFFGAAGLTLDQIEKAIYRLQNEAESANFGFNLIHSPNEPELEAATVDLYIKHQIRKISASAYMDLTPWLVLYRLKGIHKGADGKIVCPNKIIGKVSRVEVARKFLSPPPEKFLKILLEAGRITPKEAELAGHVPMADDLTAEADSGGHTDNRPALALLPTILALRDTLCRQFNYESSPCVGLGGGISTPASAGAAFAMGAAFILTGTVNQACIEAGTSETVRNMLAKASQADVTMAPAADMFEMGVKVQVLKRGTMFPLRAARLYDYYCRYSGLHEIPDADRSMLEKDFFHDSFEKVWENTRDFFLNRNPEQVKRAEQDPKHKMALVFRSYLGLSSGWANAGDPERTIDYQIWCGPAIGAFNEWTRGSFLEAPTNREVVTVALNLLIGAALTLRANMIRCQGVPLPSGATNFQPMRPEQMEPLLTPAEILN